MGYRHQIALDILGFACKKEDVSNILGIAPDVAWNAGDAKESGGFYRRSVWILYSKAQNLDGEFSEHAEYISNAMYGKELALKDIRSIADVRLTIIGEFSKSHRPSVYLDRDFLNFACKNNLEIDFDFSVINEPVDGED